MASFQECLLGLIPVLDRLFSAPSAPNQNEAGLDLSSLPGLLTVR